MNLSKAEQERIIDTLEKVRARGVKYKFGAEAISDMNNGESITNKRISEIVEIDCSELVEWVFWNSFRLKVPDGSYRQYDISAEVNEAEALPGDLVFRKNIEGGNISHVGVYIGGGEVIESMGGAGVIKRTFEQFKKPSANTLYAGIRRISLNLVTAGV